MHSGDGDERNHARDRALKFEEDSFNAHVQGRYQAEIDAHNKTKKQLRKTAQAYDRLRDALLTVGRKVSDINLDILRIQHVSGPDYEDDRVSYTPYPDEKQEDMRMEAQDIIAADKAERGED